VRTRLIFQRVLSESHVSERRPSVRRCPWDIAIPEVMRRCPAMTCRLLKLFCGRFVDEGGPFEGLFARHRGTIVAPGSDDGKQQVDDVPASVELDAGT
jgi:hypothetical protein